MVVHKSGNWLMSQEYTQNIIFEGLTYKGCLHVVVLKNK